MKKPRKPTTIALAVDNTTVTGAVTKRYWQMELALLPALFAIVALKQWGL